MADIIRIARDRLIEDSRKAALLFLDFQHHLVGQQWQVRYYRDESRTEIDTIVAIGVRNGTGSECYKVISYGTATAIVSISETLPDVSQMVHGEIYIVLVDGIWNYVTVTNDTRRFDPITGGPYAYFNLEDGHVWYYTEHTPPGQPEYYPGILRRDDDFYTREELDEFITETLAHLRTIDDILADHERRLQEHRQELDFDAVWLKDLDNVSFPLSLSVSASPASTIWTSGTSHDIVFTLSALKPKRLGLVDDPKPEIEPVEDVTSDCKFYYKLSTDPEYTELESNVVTVEGATGINETLTYQFKGGNIEKYGRLVKNEVEYNFGFSPLYGIKYVNEEFDIDDLNVMPLTMKSEYYTATYNTDLTKVPVFAIPTAWGNLTKILSDGGVLEYTLSFTKIGTFSRVLDGQSVSYYVYVWSSKPSVATNYTYRFYN